MSLRYTISYTKYFIISTIDSYSIMIEKSLKNDYLYCFLADDHGETLYHKKNY